MAEHRAVAWVQRRIDDGRLFDAAFIAAAIGAWLGLMYLGNGLTFFADEWSIIRRVEDWSFAELMHPHNEHWMAGFKFVYRMLAAVFGLETYVPYLAVTLALHVAIAAAVYVYARRQTAALVALAMGTLFLLLGSGGENLFMAMQINFNGAAAAGAWALVIILREPSPRYAWLASLLLLVAVTFAGIGLFFTAGAIAAVALVARLRRWWWVPAPAVVAYGVWFLLYGRERPGDLSVTVETFEFVRAGISFVIGQVSGMEQQIGLVIAVLLGVALVADLAGRGPARPGLIAGSVGLLSMYVLIGMVRAGADPALAEAPRYVHPAAALLLMALAGWLGGRPDVRAGDRRLGLAVAVVGLTAVALVWNIGWMRSQLELFRWRADETRAAVLVLTTYSHGPAIPADRGLTVLPGQGRHVSASPGEAPLLPPPVELVPLLERLGSPLDDRLAFRSTAVPDQALDAVFGRLTRQALLVEPAAMPRATTPLRSVVSTDATVAADGGCLALTATGPTPTVGVEVPSGSTLYLEPGLDGGSAVDVSLLGTPSEDPFRFESGAGDSVRISIPDVGGDVRVRVTVAMPGGTSRLCLEATPAG